MPITWTATTTQLDDLINPVRQTTANTQYAWYAADTYWTESFADKQWVKEIVEAFQESDSPPDKHDFLEMLE